MSNLFQEAITDVKGMENSILYIKDSSVIDISDKGIIQQMSKDINGLIQYVELLLNGNNDSSNKSPFITSEMDITMQTITDDDLKSPETHYVSLIDMDNYICSNRKKCSKSFQREFLIPSDPLTQLYFASLGIIGIFILYRLMEKSN